MSRAEGDRKPGVSATLGNLLQEESGHSRRFRLGLLRVGAARAATAVFFSAAQSATADQAGFANLVIINDTHSADTLYSLDLIKPFGGSNLSVRPFGEFLLQRDARTLVSQLPETLNDNYGLAAVGLQYIHPGGLRAFAQIGEAFAFGPPSANFTWGPSDFRGGLSFYRNLGDGLGEPQRTIGAMYLSAVHYSRYRDNFFYVAGERGRELCDASHPLQLFGRITGTADTQNNLYDNVGTAALGARILPLGRRGPAFTLEESYNVLIGPQANLDAVGEHRAFFSLRPSLSFRTNF